MRNDSATPVLVVGLTLAVLALVLPVCAATACGMTMGDMGMALADLMACDAMNLPQDVPGAVMAAFWVAAVAVVALALQARARQTVELVHVADADSPRSSHDPPGDSLFGKLRL